MSFKNKIKSLLKGKNRVSVKDTAKNSNEFVRVKYIDPDIYPREELISRDELNRLKIVTRDADAFHVMSRVNELPAIYSKYIREVGSAIESRYISKEVFKKWDTLENMLISSFVETLISTSGKVGDANEIKQKNWMRTMIYARDADGETLLSLLIKNHLYPLAVFLAEVAESVDYHKYTNDALNMITPSGKLAALLKNGDINSALFNARVIEWETPEESYPFFFDSLAPVFYKDLVEYPNPAMIGKTLATSLIFMRVLYIKMYSELGLPLADPVLHHYMGRALENLLTLNVNGKPLLEQALIHGKPTVIDTAMSLLEYYPQIASRLLSDEFVEDALDIFPNLKDSLPSFWEDMVRKDM